MSSFNSIHIENAKTIPELAKVAALEQGGDWVFSLRKFGYSASLTANTTEDVWEYGGTWVPLTTARTLSVVSSSTSDTLAGTGARYLRIQGLDANYNVVNEDIILNGTTPVVTTNSFLRVNRMLVLLCGSSQKNVGTITATATTAATVQGYIDVGHGITEQSHFTIPAGYTLITMDTNLTVFRASGGTGSKAAEVSLMAFSPDANTFYETVKYGVRNDGGSYTVTPQAYTATKEKTTLFFRANPESTGTVVTTSVGYLLVKGSYDNESAF